MNVKDALVLTHTFIAEHIDNPKSLLWIIPLLLIVWLLLPKDFVKLFENAENEQKKKTVRRILFFTRTIILVSLLTAISSPFFSIEKEFEGDPSMTLIIDESDSMSLFKDVSSIEESLKKKVNLEVRRTSKGASSRVGDAILQNSKEFGSILLISDGQVNTGAELGDVMLLASKKNTVVNAIKLSPSEYDASVSIIGPSKVLENADTKFAVQIKQVKDSLPVHVKVTIDNQVIADQTTEKEFIEFSSKFSRGNHKITAEIESDDFFANNNVFYKSVKSAIKPKVLFVSDGSPALYGLLNKVYDVQLSSSIPNSLNNFYAVILDNLPASVLDAKVDALTNFIAEGNGLLTLGGGNSFDRGSYENSLIESILPVFVGEAAKEEGDVNVVIVIDTSRSTTSGFGESVTGDVGKSLAISALRNLKPNNKIGVVAFKTSANVVSDVKYVFEQINLEKKISSLQYSGGTRITAGLSKALTVLRLLPGSKNIILISDGISSTEVEDLSTAARAKEEGVKIYTVGVGDTTKESHMTAIASLSNGVYFRASDSSNLKILFGDTSDIDSAHNDVVVMDRNHFITSSLNPSAYVTGYNVVVPKNAGRMLLSLSSGDPLLTVWRLGLGRVGSFTSDDGSYWAGQLLSEGNSAVFVKSINWLIGEPDRKEAYVVDAEDTFVGIPANIFVKSNKFPTAEGISFYQVDNNAFAGSVDAPKAGFVDALSSIFAVNSPEEYIKIGVNPELSKMIANTGGKIFDAAQIGDIVSHTQESLNRRVISKDYFVWPFISLTLTMLFIELLARRFLRKE